MNPTPVLSVLPVPLTASNSDGLAYKPQDLATPQVGYINMIAIGLGDYALSIMLVLSIRPSMLA
jgi:hypothetical protein